MSENKEIDKTQEIKNIMELLDKKRKRNTLVCDLTAEEKNVAEETSQDVSSIRLISNGG